MKNIKKTVMAGTGLSLLFVNSVSADIVATGGGNTSNIEKSGTLVNNIETWITNLLTLLAFVAVIYGLWGGFNILTAAGDEDKVKKGKTVIINALIGIVVIFLVGMVVGWLVNFLGTNNVNG